MAILAEVIICPYCGSEDQELTDYPLCLEHDGDSCDYECHVCDMPFKVTVSVSYTYGSERYNLPSKNEWRRRKMIESQLDHLPPQEARSFAWDPKRHND